MSNFESVDGETVAELIRSSGLTIYDPIDPNDARYFDILELEELLRKRLNGLILNPPLRTRAKLSKSAVAEAMGYPLPKSFRKSQPRFVGQNLDVYVQKSDNFQVWNEKVAPLRRYALIRVDQDDQVTDVRVVTGETVASWDRTGTLTQKYQAKRRPGFHGSRLVSAVDTENFISALQPSSELPRTRVSSPEKRPTEGDVLTISEIFSLAQSLIGTTIPYQGADQERNRGAALHRRVCTTLGFRSYADTGRVPDILNQVLEVKLQTSPTVDLGLVVPSSQFPAEEVGPGVLHCDMRYAVFYGELTDPDTVRITEVVVATGQDFFSEFQQFEGKRTNKKLQIPLPKNLFR